MWFKTRVPTTAKRSPRQEVMVTIFKCEGAGGQLEVVRQPLPVSSSRAAWRGRAGSRSRWLYSSNPRGAAGLGVPPQPKRLECTLPSCRNGKCNCSCAAPRSPGGTLRMPWHLSQLRKLWRSEPPPSYKRTGVHPWALAPGPA